MLGVHAFEQVNQIILTNEFIISYKGPRSFVKNKWKKKLTHIKCLCHVCKWAGGQIYIFSVD